MKLSVLTLNCWGVPVARDRETRMQAIGEEIARLGYDIVGLQEIFYNQDQQTILDSVAEAGLIHHHYYPSGKFLSGLMIISRFPILETRFWPYSLNGRPQDLRRPDYYAGKGLAFAQIEIPMGLVDFYNTHLIAPYLEIGDDIYFSHRAGQAYEITKLVNEISKDHPLILTGDFNTTPDQLTYRTCTILGGIKDSYVEANGQEPGITVTTEIPYLEVHEPERVDYVFYRHGGDQSWEVTGSEVAFTKVPKDFEGQILAFSDHYGVHTDFQMVDLRSKREAITGEKPVFGELRSVFEDGLDQAINLREEYMRLSGISGFALAAAVLMRQRIKFTRRQFLILIYRLALVGLLVFTGLGLGLTSFESTEAEQFRKLLSEIEA